MKKLTFIFLFLLAFSRSYAQENPIPDFKGMTPEQRREFLKKLSPEQRMKVMEDATTLMAIKKLEIPAEKQDAFKKLLKDYMESQKEVKKQFKTDFIKGNPSDAEAKKMLNQSFILGQKLLDNRKIYAEKFQKILSPQQVLKLFLQEGRLREKFMEHGLKMRPLNGHNFMEEEAQHQE